MTTLTLPNRQQKVYKSFSGIKPRKGSKKVQSENDRIRAVIKSLQDSEFGCRWEGTFLNTSKETLLGVFKHLERIADNMVKVHKILESFVIRSLVPFETLRLSPIQVIKTSSIVSLAKYQSLSLHKVFAGLLHKSMSGESKTNEQVDFSKCNLFDSSLQE